MGDALREHALHLLGHNGNQDQLTEIIRILESNSGKRRPTSPGHELQEVYSRSIRERESVQSNSAPSSPAAVDARFYQRNTTDSPPSSFQAESSDVTAKSGASSSQQNIQSNLHHQRRASSESGVGGSSVTAHPVTAATSPTLEHFSPMNIAGAASATATNTASSGGGGRRRAAVSDMPMSTVDIAGFVPKVIPKSAEDLVEVRRAVQNCPNLFSSLDEDEQEIVVQAMDREEFNAGIDILKQGEESLARFYVIISGTVSVIKSGKQVATMSDGNSFGELEMMYDTLEPCAATIHAVTPIVSYFLDRQTFKNIVLKATMEKRRTYLQVLHNVPFLKGMSDYDKATLADVLQRADYEPEDHIIKFAEKSSWMHIIIAGEVKVVGREMGKKREIVRLGAGDPVGELEFLFNHAAVADVVAVTKVRTAKMNRKHFEMCMGPIADNLKLYITEGNYSHYMKNADQAVLNDISSAEQKLKRTKVATGGTAIAAGSVDSKGEIVILDNFTTVDDADGGSAKGSNKDRKSDGSGGDKAGGDEEGQSRYLYRFPLIAVHQQNSVIIGVREDGVILSWNDAAARLTNYCEKETLGQSIFSLIKSNEDQKQLHDMIHMTVRYAGNTEAFLKKFEDRRLPVSRTVFSRRDGLTHSHLSLVCVPGVIAQPKHIPEMLLLVGVESKRNVPEKENDFGDWIVEQMRQLLGADKDDEVKKESVEGLIHEFEVLRHRARTIDKDQLHAVNPRQLLGQVVSSLQHDAVERGNTISTQFAGNVPDTLFCDTELLPEVLRVALHNCVKHNRDSTIRIDGEIVTDRGLEYLEVSLTDNGPGIDAAEIRAFEKSGIKTPSGFASSGLIKLKAAVSKLGGTMSVRSVANENTCVSFRVQYLPSEDDVDLCSMASPTTSAGGQMMLRQQSGMYNNSDASSDGATTGGVLSSSATTTTTTGGADNKNSSGVDSSANNSNNQSNSDAATTTTASGGHNTVAAAPTRTYTTLVAEEHAVSRNALCSFLWNRKHAVVPAHNSADFMRLVDSCDIIIVDPDQRLIDSSIDIFALLQRLERRAAVVVSGSNVSSEIRDAHSKAGFITLSKPFSPVATVAAIKRAEDSVNRIKAEQEKVAAMRATFNRTNRGEWSKGALLGKGAFGDVYEAIDVLTGGKMAVKMMRITKNQNKQDLINEIEVMCTLRHPNIIHYFYCEDVPEEGRINIFMEFAGNGTLDSKASKLGRGMTPQEMKPILVDIVEGVKYIHSRRFVHCDLKTPNVLFGADGRGKIGDFGTARQLAEGQKLYNMSGTIQYMSPECMAADREEDRGYDFAADIWSIGCIAMELATGKPPWMHLPCRGAGMPLIAYMTEITEEQGSPDLSHLFDVAPSVFEFVRACLDINPDKRPNAAGLLDFSLLRESQEDNDVSTALKSLQKAKLIHHLNQFVAFSEPEPAHDGSGNHSSHRYQQHGHQHHSSGDGLSRHSHDHSGRGHSKRRTSIYERGFFDSDEESLPTPDVPASPQLPQQQQQQQQQNSTGGEATKDSGFKTGGFFDTDDDDDDDDDNNEGSGGSGKNHKSNSETMPPSKNDGGGGAKTGDTLTLGGRSGDGSTRLTDDGTLAGGGNSPSRTTPIVNKPQSSQQQQLSSSPTSILLKPTAPTEPRSGGGGAPHSPQIRRAAVPMVLQHSDTDDAKTKATNNSGGGGGGDDDTSGQELTSSSMAVHEKLTLLLEKVSQKLDLHKKHQNGGYSPAPFVPNIDHLMRTHAEQLDHFLKLIGDE